MIRKFISFFIFLICIQNTTNAKQMMDLAEMTQDFVLSSKRIEIPGHPNAFNPSIIRWNGSLLLSFRTISDIKLKYHSQIGLVWLDEDFNVISTPQLLEMKGASNSILARTDDARLVKVGDTLWLVYSDNKEPVMTRGGFRVYISPLYLDGDCFHLLHEQCLSSFEGENQLVREKNWSPFDYEGGLLLAYSLTPHRIFYPEPQGNTCYTIAETQTEFNWGWGIPRGSTSALKIGDHYLSFFHSSLEMTSKQSKGQPSLHYFAGAYLFSATPPFAITHVSERPIVGKGFYENDIYQPYWKPVTVVYPCGFLVEDNFIWLTYGQHDREAWVAKLDKQALLNSLLPILEES